MKNFLTKGVLFSALSLSLLGGTAHAVPQAEEMCANYRICDSTDESWFSRWGQYVVAYDYDKAAQICRNQSWPRWGSTPAMTGCYHQGKWIDAGYYCQEINT